MNTKIKDEVKEYYGQTLENSESLQTNACCCDSNSLPNYVKKALANIDDEILEKYYGCGSPIPTDILGCTILDLGCGTGRDVYTASQLVGEDGFVIGIDMTEEQLSVAEKHLQSQMNKFGYKKTNVKFIKADIENLSSAGIESNSVDLIISNCVINLATDKKKVFSEIFRVLKPGGELYFSDIFTNRRVPKDISEDPIMYGECLGGTLYIEDFRRLLASIKCEDYRVVSSSIVTINNPEIIKKAGDIIFCSITIRAFKLDDLEDICEDYGQTVKYKGNLKGSPCAFQLDNNHTFQTGKEVAVCGNTASMLQNTRYAKYFEISGDRTTHYGAFDCGDSILNTANGGCC